MERLRDKYNFYEMTKFSHNNWNYSNNSCRVRLYTVITCDNEQHNE